MNLDKPVSELMTKDVLSVTPMQLLADVKELLAAKRFHYNIPVIENNKLKGMVVLTDLMFAINHEPANNEEKDYTGLLIKDIMREKVTVISPNATVREVAGVFANGESHSLMIVDDGSLKGIISSADIIRYLLQH